jgi:hypothetical protein
MSAWLRPDWGRPGGELSTLIDRAGRWLTLGTTKPVSGATVGPLAVVLLPLEQLAATSAAVDRATPIDSVDRCRRPGVVVREEGGTSTG